MIKKSSKKPARKSREQTTWFDEDEEQYVKLGGVVIGEKKLVWVVLVGLDTIYIPKSCSEIRPNKAGDERLWVPDSFLEREKGIKRGVFRNNRLPSRDEEDEE